MSSLGTQTVFHLFLYCWAQSRLHKCLLMNWIIKVSSAAGLPAISIQSSMFVFLWEQNRSLWQTSKRKKKKDSSPEPVSHLDKVRTKCFRKALRLSFDLCSLHEMTFEWNFRTVDSILYRNRAFFFLIQLIEIKTCWDMR